MVQALPQIPKYLSVVLLFDGPQPIRLTDNRLEAIVGSKHAGKGTADGGPAFLWQDGLQVFARSQGLHRNRLEVKQEAPAGVYLGRVVDIAWKLLAQAKDKTPVSVGINYAAMVLDHTGRISDTMGTVVDKDRIKQWFGKIPRNVSQVRVTFGYKKSKVNVHVKLGEVESLGGLQALEVDLNYDLPTPSKTRMTEVLAAPQVAEVEKDILKILSRFGRMPDGGSD